MIPFVINSDRLSVFLKGKPYTFESSNPKFQPLVDALRNNLPEEEVLCLLEEKEQKEFLFEGTKVSKALQKRIDFMQERGIPLKGVSLFLENLKQNPSYESVKDLYDFLDACDLPITDDGCFLAYKKVRKDFRDCHTGTLNNAVGKTVSMQRDKVDADRNVTCSTGLHVCSKAYLSQFGGDRTIVCKVNPKDVVSVPIDYDHAKMRVCEYTVIGCLDEGEEIRSMAVSKSKKKKSSKKKATAVMQTINKAEKFDAYVKERSLPEQISDMTKNQRNALRKFSARLLFGEAHAAGEAINSCKTLTDLKKTVCGE